MLEREKGDKNIVGKQNESIRIQKLTDRPTNQSEYEESERLIEQEGVYLDESPENHVCNQGPQPSNAQVQPEWTRTRALYIRDLSITSISLVLLVHSSMDTEVVHHSLAIMNALTHGHNFVDHARGGCGGCQVHWTRVRRCW